jgi:hypothetical protein
LLNNHPYIGLPDTATVKGIRNASAQFLLVNAGIEACLANGGWLSNFSLSGINKGFEYLGFDETLIVKSQLALSGAINLKGKMHAPRLDVIYGAKTTKENVDLWIDLLFDLPTTQFKKGGNLRAVAETVFATFMMHCEEFFNEFGNQLSNTSNTNIATTQITLRLSNIGLPKKLVFEYGQLIKDDYNMRNLHLTIDYKDPLGPVVEKLTAHLANNELEIKVSTIKQLLCIHIF